MYEQTMKLAERTRTAWPAAYRHVYSRRLLAGNNRNRSTLPVLQPHDSILYHIFIIPFGLL